MGRILPASQTARALAVSALPTFSCFGIAPETKQSTLRCQKKSTESFTENTQARSRATLSKRHTCAEHAHAHAQGGPKEHPRAATTMPTMPTLAACNIYLHHTRPPMQDTHSKKSCQPRVRGPTYSTFFSKHRSFLFCLNLFRAASRLAKRICSVHTPLAPLTPSMAGSFPLAPLFPLLSFAMGVTPRPLCPLFPPVLLPEALPFMDPFPFPVLPYPLLLPLWPSTPVATMFVDPHRGAPDPGVITDCCCSSCSPGFPGA
jgi:hypothetical protein